MATIKSFTSIEQSKKLAEILPLESADMYYPWYIEEDGDTIESGHRLTTPNVCEFTTHKINKMTLPCWSLAALLGVLPNSTDICKNIEGRYYVHGFFSDNPVDACVDAIKALHELKLL